jgi:hypothetical protein
MNAGTPQGIISGPDDFKLLINNFKFDIQYIKYVDDTTAFSVSINPDDLSLQHAADGLCVQSHPNGMVVTENKTNEMMVHFGSIVNAVSTVCVNGEHIERVHTSRLLGTHVSGDLSWDVHVEYTLTEFAKCMQRIHCLIRIGADASDLILVYCSINRSTID